jgi:chromatin remodeling complex protein RSC6
MPAKKTTTQAPKGSTESKKTPTTKKVSEPVKAEPVKAEAVKAEPVKAEPVKAEVQNDVVQQDVVEHDEIGQCFMELMKKLQLLSTTFVSLKQDFKALEKRYSRELKAAQKHSEKKRKPSAKPRQPSGFVKPTKISDDLAVFLEKESGSEMARTEVTREINKYIRTHNLQDPTNGRKINPDVKLRTLLEVPTTEELTYFNLQKYLSKHFPKQPPAVSVVAGSS